MANQPLLRRLMGPNATEFGEITQNKGHYAVQDHSRSLKVTDLGISPETRITVLHDAEDHSIVSSIIYTKVGINV